MTKRAPLPLLASVAGSAIALAVLASPARAEEPSLKMGAIGGGVFAAGWVAGALPAVPPEDDATHRMRAPNAESQTALVPVVGPLWWWGKVYARVDARADYEKAHPCKGTGEPMSCVLADTASIDRFFHVTLALPWMVAATGAQAAGLGLVVLAVAKPGGSSRGARAVVTPTAQGLMVSGTF